MNADDHNIERFLALSELYFRLTGKTSSEISAEEFQEFLEIINDQAPPVMSPGQHIC